MGEGIDWMNDILHDMNERAYQVDEDYDGPIGDGPQGPRPSPTGRLRGFQPPFQSVRPARPERREMDPDKEIRLLTSRIAEIQEEKERQAPLQELRGLAAGAVVYFTKTFPLTSVTTYHFAAVLTFVLPEGEERWHVTGGQQNLNWMPTAVFLDFLKNADEVVLLQPMSKTLRRKQEETNGGD